jgi:HD superfamily phosphohydrolase
MHLAGKMAERLLMTKELGKNFCSVDELRELCGKGRDGFPEIKTLSDQMFEITRKIQITRIAGLLHDLGHCGFSHTLEAIFLKYQKVDHEQMTISILENSDEIKSVFEENKTANDLNIKISDIEAILKRTATDYPYLCEIISGTIDVDKIDYIARDAFHTGTTEYGAVDAARLTDSIVVEGDSLIPDSSAVETVIAFWQARFHMFSAVYYHRVARAMEIIIQNMVDQFILQYQGMEESERPKTLLSSFAKLEAITDYLLLDDYSIVSELSRLRKEGHKFESAFRFFDMYLRRKPLTVVDEYRVGPIDQTTWKMLTDRKKLEAMKDEISDLSKVPKEFIFVDAPPEVQIKVNPVFGRLLKDILVFDKKSGGTRSIEEFDPKTVDALSALRGLIRVYTLDKYYKEVKKGYDDYAKKYMQQ